MLSLKIVMMLCVFVAGLTGMGQAETYMWTDKNGDTHFSDRPPDHGKAKKLAPSASKLTVTQQAEAMADEWWRIACNHGAAFKLLVRYQELQNEATAKLGECRRGNSDSCDYLGVTFGEAHMENERTLTKRYVPVDIRELAVARHKNQHRTC